MLRSQPPRAAERAVRDSVHAKALELVRASLEMTAAAGSGHPTSAASLAHVVVALLYAHMRWDPTRPDHPASDRLVLSEGHAVPIVYAAGADLGIAIGGAGSGAARRPMTRADAMGLRAIDGPIEGHPSPLEGFPFFPAATGSLGQGLSVALGLALAARLDGIPKRVFCVLGDGESREGQVWEALDLLVDQRLHAVCPIFNSNGEGQTGPVSPQQSAQALARKLEAFGLEPVLFDGHSPDAVLAALEWHARRADEAASADPAEPPPRPVALVARTVKGWGTPSLAAQRGGMHGKPAEGAALDRALLELDERAQALDAAWSDGALRIPALPRAEPPEVAAAPRDELPPLDEALAELGREDELARGRLSTRRAYGVALRVLGAARSDVVVLDGDVSNSTGAEEFARERRLAPRFVECRIAEQNMVSCAAGLSSAGKRPFVSTFGKFVTRAYDQVEMALVGGAALRLVGSHAGIGASADGPSQMALPDAAWFASLARVRRDGRPLLHVLTPSDAFAAYELTLDAAYHDGSTYLRTLRPELPLLYGPERPFRLGGHRVLREGRDVALLAWGHALHEALAAAAELGALGIRAAVVDLYSLPFDEDEIAALARESSGRVVTVEDNYGGALGAAVAEALSAAGGSFALRRLHVSRVPKSGRTPRAVLEHVGLSRADVARAARNLVESRPRA